MQRERLPTNWYSRICYVLLVNLYLFLHKTLRNCALLMYFEVLYYGLQCEAQWVAGGGKTEGAILLQSAELDACCVCGVRG